MRALMAFSGRRTVKRLYKVPSKSKITIRCLMGLRVISMIWVFTGHAFAWVQVETSRIMLRSFVNKREKSRF